MKKRVLKIATILLTGLAIVSCNKNDDGDTVLAFNPTVLSSNTSDLYEAKGDVANDTAWVYVQGGPTIQRDYVFEEKYEDGSDVYPYITDDLRIYPFQVHQTNKEIQTYADFTLEQAKVESAKNAEIIKRVVEHLESQNKTVYIIGHSYGSLVVNEVLAEYGQIGRKIASFNGRLDMDQVVWEGFSRGEEWLFEEDGLNPSHNPKADASVLEKNMRKMAAGLGFNRYTKRLATVDLSDAIFLTASNDMFVGDFTAEALSLLQPKAEALFVLEGLGHSDVFDPSIFEQLHALIIEDN